MASTLGFIVAGILYSLSSHWFTTARAVHHLTDGEMMGFDKWNQGINDSESIGFGNLARTASVMGPFENHGLLCLAQTLLLQKQHPTICPNNSAITSSRARQ